jgi:hypothetical protein
VQPLANTASPKTERTEVRVAPRARFAAIGDVVPMIGIAIAIAPAALRALITSKLASILAPLASLLRSRSRWRGSRDRVTAHRSAGD